MSRPLTAGTLNFPRKKQLLGPIPQVDALLRVIRREGIDVLALQELHEVTRQILLGRAGVRLVSAAPNNTKRATIRNALLIRDGVPVKKLPDLALPWKGTERGALYLPRALVAGTTVTGVHLPTRRRLPDGHPARDRMHRALTAGDGPALLLGDFNQPAPSLPQTIYRGWTRRGPGIDLVLARGGRVTDVQVIRAGIHGRLTDHPGAVLATITAQEAPMPDPRLVRPAWRGRTNVDALTIACVEHAEQLGGHTFTVTQGSYQASVAASAGTHARGGAVDLRWCGHDSCITALRRAGLAAWHRRPDQGRWPHHIHAVVIGHPDLAPAAARQVTAYYAGRNGLANNGADDGPRLDPIPRPVWPWPPTTQEDDMPYTEQQLAKIIREAVAAELDAQFRDFDAKVDVGRPAKWSVGTAFRSVFSRLGRVEASVKAIEEKVSK